MCIQIYKTIYLLVQAVLSFSYWLKRFLVFSSFSHWGEDISLRGDGMRRKIRDKNHTMRLPDACWPKSTHPFSFPPAGGSTRAARGKNGDLGERESWEGEGPSVWLSDSPLFFSWAWNEWTNLVSNKLQNDQLPNKFILF